MNKWRVGKKLGRTLYVNDQVVGMVDTKELAAQIVERMNEESGDNLRNGAAEYVKAMMGFAEKVSSPPKTMTGLRVEHSNGLPQDDQSRPDSTKVMTEMHDHICGEDCPYCISTRSEDASKKEGNVDTSKWSYRCQAHGNQFQTNREKCSESRQQMLDRIRELEARLKRAEELPENDTCQAEVLYTHMNNGSERFNRVDRAVCTALRSRMRARIIELESALKYQSGECCTAADSMKAEREKVSKLEGELENYKNSRCAYPDCLKLFKDAGHWHCHSHCTRLHEDLATERAKVIALDKELAGKQEMHRDLTQYLAKVEKSLRDERAEHEKTRKQRNEAIERNSNFRADIFDLERQLSEEKAASERLAEDVRELNAGNVEDMKKIADLERQLADEREQRSKWEARANWLRKELKISGFKLPEWHEIDASCAGTGA